MTAFEVRLHGDTVVTTHNDLESEDYTGFVDRREGREIPWIRVP